MLWWLFVILLGFKIEVNIVVLLFRNIKYLMIFFFEKGYYLWKYIIIFNYYVLNRLFCMYIMYLKKICVEFWFLDIFKKRLFEKVCFVEYLV